MPFSMYIHLKYTQVGAVFDLQIKYKYDVFMAKILIVEDDEDIGNILERELGKDGYEILRAYSGTEGRLLLSSDPDLILMDLMLPGMSGEELLSHITDGTPVIAVSARAAIDDKVSLLEMGCVDYITKPFEIRELKARVQAALRTSSKSRTEQILQAGDVTLNISERTVKVKESSLHLTRTEYAIFKILMVNKGRVISKSEILDMIASETPDCIDEGSMKVHVSNIRKKIKNAGGADPIEAVWGIGLKIS